MNKRYFYLSLAIAIACAVFIPLALFRTHDAAPEHAETIPRPTSPFKSAIFGVGIVIAGSDNISIGTPMHRLVDKVLVKVGAKVKAGDPLLYLENRDLKADLAMQLVAYDIAVAQLERLQAYPRAEDLETAAAALKSAEIEKKQAHSQFEMTSGLQDSRGISLEEINRRRFNDELAGAKYQAALADYKKIQAGTWKPDIDIAKLEIQRSKAEVERIKTSIRRTVIRSPIDATVLQLNIEEGEYPPSDTSMNPMIILGNTDEKRIKVSINQFNAPAFNPKARAVAYMQGDARVEFPLEFVRLEPYLVPKQHLTNDITDKIDTRVLQVVYRVTERSQQLLVGQQMDVFIETDRSPEE